MLLADVIRQVQREFGDDNEIFLTKQDIVDFVNEARIRIARDANIGYASNTFTASVGSYTFASSSSTTIPAIRRVSYGTKAIQYMSLETLDSINVDRELPGEPEFYYVQGNTLKLFPKPLATDSTTVTVETNSIFANLIPTDSDLQIPVQYHNDLVLFAIARAHHRDQNHRAAELKMAEFEKNIALRRYDSEHPTEDFAVVRDDPWDHDFGVGVW